MRFHLRKVQKHIYSHTRNQRQHTKHPFAQQQKTTGKKKRKMHTSYSQHQLEVTTAFDMRARDFHMSFILLMDLRLFLNCFSPARAFTIYKGIMWQRIFTYTKNTLTNTFIYRYIILVRKRKYRFNVTTHQIVAHSSYRLQNTFQVFTCIQSNENKSC